MRPPPSASSREAQSPGWACSIALAFFISLIAYLAVLAGLHLAAPNVTSVRYARAEGGSGSSVALQSHFHERYGSVQVYIEKQRSPLKPAARTAGWLSLFGVALLTLRKSPALRTLAVRCEARLRFLHPVETLALLLIGAWVLSKPAIIDMQSLGQVIRGIREGVDFYTVSALQGAGGELPIFPYNPPTYFLLAMLSEAEGILASLGLPLGGHHSLLYGLLFVAYLSLVATLTRSAEALGLPLLRGRRLFYFLLLNPLGLYYMFVLGQVDVLALMLIVAGLYRLYFSDTRLTVPLLIIGLCLAKPQHLIVLPPLILAGIGHRDARRHHVRMAVVALGCALCYALFAAITPGFYEALGTNPQAARLAWSEWWSYFAGAITINRPVGYTMLALLILSYLAPEEYEDPRQAFVAALAGSATLIGSFQASFAHTFGLAIFLFPAVALLVVSGRSLFKAGLLSLASLGLVAAWGTGIIGDLTLSLGIDGKRLDDLTDSKIAGIGYTSVMHSIETAAYLGFACICALHLTRLKTRMGPG